MASCGECTSWLRSRPREPVQFQESDTFGRWMVDYPPREKKFLQTSWAGGRNHARAIIRPIFTRNVFIGPGERRYISRSSRCRRTRPCGRRIRETPPAFFRLKPVEGMLARGDEVDAGILSVVSGLARLVGILEEPS